MNAFLREFIASVNSEENFQVFYFIKSFIYFGHLAFQFSLRGNYKHLHLIQVTQEVFEDLKGRFMEVYDDNKDGKIDIREMAQLLPMEENFLLLFRFDNPLESSVEFMKVMEWLLLPVVPQSL